jgi:hypothetical protein
MRDIVISTAIILVVGLVGSLLFQALTAPDMPVAGAAPIRAEAHDAAVFGTGAGDVFTLAVIRL